MGVDGVAVQRSQSFVFPCTPRQTSLSMEQTGNVNPPRIKVEVK